MNYEEICFGPRADNLEELTEIITGSNWRDFSQYRQQRDVLSARLFPNGTSGGYAKRSYEMILKLLEKEGGS